MFHSLPLQISCIFTLFLGERVASLAEGFPVQVLHFCITQKL